MSVRASSGGGVVTADSVEFEGASLL